MQRRARSFLFAEAFSYFGLVLGATLSGLSLSAMADISVTPSGAAIYSIPIQSAPGVSGMEPQVTLTYNSQGGVNLLGQGWSVSGLSSIVRCPKTVLEDGFDRAVLGTNGNGTTTVADATTSTTDAFCLDGQRLIKTDGSPGIAGGVYHLERDNFSQITFSSASNQNQWIVQTPDGQKKTYTASTESSVTNVWPLTAVADTSGNTMTLTYTADANNGAAVRPLSINYGPTSAPSSINFFYETRPDPQAGWFSFAPSANTQRLRMVQVAANNTEVQRYLISYTPSASSQSLINQIQVCVPTQGHEGPALTNTTTNSKTNEQCLPPVKLSYGTPPQSFGSTALNGPAFTTASGFYQNSVSPAFQFSEINGDGVPDICTKTASGLSCWLGQASGNSLNWSNNTSWATQTSMTNNIYYNTLRLIDADGDGLPDACARATDGIHCYLNSGNGFNKGVVNGPAFADSAGWGAAPYANGIAFTDLNNDGYADVCGRGAAGLWCALFNPSSGTFSTPINSIPALSDANVMMSVNGKTLATYNSLRYTDINGDGYIDVCGLTLSTNNNITSALGTCWLNNGTATGSFDNAKTVSIGGSAISNFAIPSQADASGNYPLSAYPAFADLDGDGIPDVCYRLSQGFSCYGISAKSNTVTATPINVDGLTQNVPTTPGSGTLTSSQGLFPTAWTNSNHPKDFSEIKFIDVNGDHRIDICSRSYQGLYCFQNTPSAAGASYSAKFVPQQFGLAPLGCTDQSAGPCVSDAAGFAEESSYSTLQFFNLPNRLTGLFIRSTSGNAPVYAVGGTNYLASNTSTPAGDLLTQVQVGSLTPQTISYQVGTLNPSVYTKGNAASSSTKNDLKAFDLQQSSPIVSQVSKTDPYSGQVTATSYSYSGLVAQLRRGFLGFSSVLSTTVPSNAWTKITYHQDWPYIGLPNTITVGDFDKSASTNDWLTQTQYSYTAADISNSANTIADSPPSSSCVLTPSHLQQQSVNGYYFTYPHQVTTTARSVNNLNILSDSSIYTAIQTTGTPQTGQGNTTCVHSKKHDAISNQAWEKLTQNTFDNAPQWTANGNWILGRLKKSTVTTSAPDAAFLPVSLPGTQSTANDIMYNKNGTNTTQIGISEISVLLINQLLLQ